MSNNKLFKWSRDLLHKSYQGRDRQVKGHLVTTLAMMVTGLLLAPHVQLFAIAMCVPWDIKLQSLVRRFERFVADGRVDVQVYFEPFVRAMQASLGNETAYLIIDCTKAGSSCRTLFIGLAYHGTVLPSIWQTIEGKKGHVEGEFQRSSLEKWSRSRAKRRYDQRQPSWKRLESRRSVRSTRSGCSITIR